AVANAGGAFDVRLDDRALPSGCGVALAPGARLTIRAGEWGAWSYVAFGAAFDIAPTLGSLACHSRSGLGVKPFAAGDALPLRDITPAPAKMLSLDAPWLARDDAPIRVLPGPQDDYFPADAFELFLSTEWRLAARSDRMAYALEGPRLEHARGHDIISDGVAFGAIQIPGSGAPFVLMADRQPTGGYPKIATVISADLGRLAQKRPGESVRFKAVTWDEAVAARRDYFAARAAGPRMIPLAGDLSAALLNENLVGGFVSAKE
ncbi:MAG: urea amidolyase, partial [Methylocystis sp.]|nr:urea amidolyase [Methylocystis sp.]